jgi:hypothetical protein
MQTENSVERLDEETVPMGKMHLRRGGKNEIALLTLIKQVVQNITL